MKKIIGNFIFYDPEKLDRPIQLEALEPDLRKPCFSAKKLLAGLVYDMSSLEGNPITFPEVQTLLDGITVGGHKISDQEQVLNLKNAWVDLIQKTLSKEFKITKSFFCDLHALVARNEALTWGEFRTGRVTISGTDYKPPLASELDPLYQQVIQDLSEIKNPFYRGALFFLAGSRAQFFFDCNKRTSRLMMNGILMTNGYDPILIPAKKQLEFNIKMLEFYGSGDATEMVNFLINCHPALDLVDVSQLRM